MNKMRFTKHTGLKITPFELHRDGKPRIGSTNVIRDGKSFLSKRSESSVLAENIPKIPQYVSRKNEGEVSK